MLNKSKKIISILISSTILVSTLTACTDAGTLESSSSNINSSTSETNIAVPDDAPWKNRDNEEVTVRTVFTKGMTGIANRFALEHGWYEDAGIIIEDLDATDDVVSAFGAGEVDIADGDPSTYIPAIANGVDIKIVSNMWRNKGAYWIVANNEIKTLDDLKGKTVGSAKAAGGMKLTLMEVLEQNGIDPNEDIEMVANGTYEEAYASLVSGEVDATIIHQPYATLAEEEIDGNVLAKTWEYLPDYHTGTLVATQDMIDEQPEVLERVLEVYFYVNEYCKNNFDEFIPWAAEYMNLSEDTVRTAIEEELVLWENDPIVDVERLQVTEDLLVKHGMQKEAFSVDNVVDNTFAEKVAQTLKLGEYSEQ